MHTLLLHHICSMLMTLDEGAKLLPVPCRVGQAVDVVAQVRGDLVEAGCLLAYCHLWGHPLVC